jgi:hypothetical protein
MKTETPRTDNERHVYFGDFFRGGHVSADFARELERENARLKAHMTEAWKLIYAMAGQEYWQRAEDWLAENREYAPKEIISANDPHHPHQPE